MHSGGMEILMIQKRNIALAILFSILTCGIYGIYWFIKLNDDFNQLSDAYNRPSGALTFLFTLVTCGIYGLYWSYKIGADTEKMKNNENSFSALGLIYLLLWLFGLGIVVYALVQSDINEMV